MLRDNKTKMIEEIRDRIGRMSALLLTDYQGINVEAMTTLRREFRKAGVEYTVVKNTLLRIAMEGKPFAESVKPHLNGMTALAWTYEDPAAPARVIRDFQRTSDNKPAIKCGVVGGHYLDGPAAAMTADLPSMEQARAILLATLQAPATQFLSLLQAPARQVLNVVAARKRSLEESV